MTTLRARLALMAALVLLTGCFLPDDFDARVSALRDGRVQLMFEGRVVHVAGALDATAETPDDAMFETLLGQMRRDGRMRSVSHLGDGVYEMSYIVTTRLEPGQTLAFPPSGAPWLTVTRGRNGEATLSTRAFTADEALALRRIGFNYRGRLILDPQAPITAHNGQTDPGLVDASILWTFAGADGAAARATITMDR